MTSCPRPFPTHLAPAPTSMPGAETLTDQPSTTTTSKTQPRTSQGSSASPASDPPRIPPRRGARRHPVPVDGGNGQTVTATRVPDRNSGVRTVQPRARAGWTIYEPVSLGRIRAPSPFSMELYFTPPIWISPGRSWSVATEHRVVPTSWR